MCKCKMEREGWGGEVQPVGAWNAPSPPLGIWQLHLITLSRLFPAPTSANQRQKG